MHPNRRTFLLSAAATLAVARTAAPASFRQTWTPKLSENLADVQPATLRWLAQLGCKHVIF
jgi:hypothetical protein